MTVADLLGCGRKDGPRKREKDDFMPTPDDGTVQALMRVERVVDRPTLNCPIWEPFCGDGAISKVLIERGHDVIETDLVDRGRNTGRIDFLLERKALGRIIVSNPPFKLAVQIVRHARENMVGVDYMALLLKADFANSKKASDAFKVWKPARVHALSWRPDFTGEGSPPLNCSWWIWDGNPLHTIFDVVDRQRV